MGKKVWCHEGMGGGDDLLLKKCSNSVCHLCFILIVANLTLQNFHFAFILICKIGWNFAVFSALLSSSPKLKMKTEVQLSPLFEINVLTCRLVGEVVHKLDAGGSFDF